MSVSYKTKVAKMLFIVVIIFVVLRVPFTALVFIRNQMLQNNFVDQILGSFQVLWYASHYLIFFNAAINPLIYGLTNDNFRRAYHQTPFLFCFYKPKIGKKKKVRIYFTMQTNTVWKQVLRMAFGGEGCRCPVSVDSVRE